MCNLILKGTAFQGVVFTRFHFDFGRKLCILPRRIPLMSRMSWFLESTRSSFLSIKRHVGQPLLLVVLKAKTCILWSLVINVLLQRNLPRTFKLRSTRVYRIISPDTPRYHPRPEFFLGDHIKLQLLMILYSCNFLDPNQHFHCYLPSSNSDIWRGQGNETKETKRLMQRILLQCPRLTCLKYLWKNVDDLYLFLDISTRKNLVWDFLKREGPFLFHYLSKY